MGLKFNIFILTTALLAAFVGRLLVDKGAFYKIETEADCKIEQFGLEKFTAAEDIQLHSDG
eukprot:gene19360-956_t